MVNPVDQDPEAVEFWQQVLAQLEHQVTRPNWETWLKDSAGFALEDGRLVVAAPSEFAAEWLSTKLRPLCAKVVSEMAGRAMEIEVVTWAPSAARRC